MNKVLITGGASGLGAAITRTFANHSDFLVYFTYCKSEKNANEICKNFPNSIAIKCDFSKEDNVQALCNQITSMNLDILVNNAYTGDYLKNHFHKNNPSEFIDDFKINILPLIKITQSAISCFRVKKNGKIITIGSSVLINKPPTGASVYSSGKAYIEQLSKSWAVENIRFNITSNMVSPSFMHTDMTASIDERIVEQLISSHPLKRVLTTEEVAEVVFFLSKTTSFLNGVNIVLNAGTDIS